MQSDELVRIQPSLLKEIRNLAEAEGVPVDQFVNVAVAEKLSALRTASYFRERIARANIPEALRILDRIGDDEPPVPGDEIPEDLAQR